MAEAKTPSAAEMSQIRDLVRAAKEKGLADKKPVEEIEAGIMEFLDAKGVTPEQLKAFNPGVVEDVTNLAPGALRTGIEAIPGGPGSTSELAPEAIRAILEKSGASKKTLSEFDAALHEGKGGIPYLTPAVSAITEHLPDMSTVRKGTDWAMEQGRGLLGLDQPAPEPEYSPQTGVGTVMKTGIENLPSVATGGGSLWSKGLDLVGSTFGEEGAAKLYEMLPDTLKQYAPEIVARILGSGIGSKAPDVHNKVVNPRPIDRYRQPHVDVMDREGVELSAGQRTKDDDLRKLEQQTGGVASLQRQSQQFTQAAARRQGGFGPDTERLDRPTMKAELDRMGAEFDRLSANSTTPFDQTLQNDLLDSTTDYLADNPHIAPVIEQTMNELADNAARNNGVLSGEAYQNTRTRINDKIRNENTDPGVRGALIEMQDALDEAVGRNLPPEEQRAWRTVRTQYRNYLPLESAMASPGATAEGLISAKQLQAGIKANMGKRSRATGQNDFQDLADAGEVTMTEPRSSGTPEGLKAQGLRATLTGLASLAGGGGVWAGTQALGVDPMLAGGAGLITSAATTGIPAAVRKAKMTPTGQAILGRQGPRVDTGDPTSVVGIGPGGGTGEVSPAMARFILATIRAEAMRDRSDQKGR